MAKLAKKITREKLIQQKKAAKELRESLKEKKRLKLEQLKKKKDFKKKDILDQELDQSEDEQICLDKIQRPRRKCTFGRTQRKDYSYDRTSPDRYGDNESGRKVKAARPTEMPDKWEYPWEASEPAPVKPNKRKLAQQHYPVLKIKKLSAI